MSLQSIEEFMSKVGVFGVQTEVVSIRSDISPSKIVPGVKITQENGDEIVLKNERERLAFIGGMNAAFKYVAKQ